MIIENENVEIEETIILEKFEGEPLPENLIERVYLKNGKVEKVEKIKKPKEIGG